MKNLNILKNNIIAHRGYYNNNEGIIENTLQAFKKALDFTYQELKKIKLLNTKEIIPTFKTVLDYIDGKVPIIIEFKSDVFVGKLEKETMKI